jgi:prepilin-type N-terminal cleavage/methylation domain-containing protein
MKRDSGNEIDRPIDRRRSDGGRWTRQAGYSLSELLVVIAMIALVVLFGGPALANAYKSYKVRAAADGLTTNLRALRYTAVAERAPRSLTINDEAATPANQYSYVNKMGKNILVTLDGVVIESASPASITFGINGGTGLTSNLDVLLSMTVSRDRGERYTITVTPTGTVTADFTTFTP